MATRDDEGLLTDAKHCVSTDAEGADLGDIWVSFCYFAETGPVLGTEGEAVVAIGYLFDDGALR